MTDKPWNELTGAEKAARMAEGKRRKAEERVAAAAAPPLTANPNIVKIPTGEAPDFFAPVELSDDEVLEIRAWALAEAKREQKQRKVEAMKAAALAQAREEMGLVPPPSPKDAERARLDELVAVTIDIPEGGARDGDFIWLDQRQFANGVTYTVSRAQFETIRDICNKQWVQWSMFKGERMNHYNRMRGRYESAYGGGYAAGSGGRALQVPHAGVPTHMEQG